MDDDTNLDAAVSEVVEQAQNLDRWKQAILQNIRDEGGDPDQVRIIVAHKVGDEYTATEIQGYPH